MAAAATAHQAVTIFDWNVAKTGTTLFCYMAISPARAFAHYLHMSESLKVAMVFARVRRRFRLLALLPALIAFVAPTISWGDIYKWTDEHGRTNISNVLPDKTAKAKNVEIVVKEAKPTAIPARAATPTEQALLTRIESLERQLQASQYAAPAAPPPTPYSAYYPSTSPPPSPSYYNNGGYYDSYYYPSYYPIYSYRVAPPYVVYRARTFVSRPIFTAPRGALSHSGGGHRGRR